MSLPNLSTYVSATYRRQHRLDSGFVVSPRYDSNTSIQNIPIQNNPIDEIEQIDESESDDESETTKQYYTSIIKLKNKTLTKHEKNNDALRSLFKNVIDHQDRCQTIETDIKYIQQNEITLHEKYIDELEKNVDKLKKKLQYEKISYDINKVKIEKLENQNNVFKKQIQCVVCKEKDRTILFLPCKHCICCLECSNNLYTNKCPTCRTDISEKQSIFIT